MVKRQFSIVWFGGKFILEARSNRMKIVAIADTHNRHEDVQLPEGDLLIHAGDFTHFGSGWDEFLAWFEEQGFDHRLLVLGNHERFGESWEQTTALEGELIQRETVTYLKNWTVEIGGLTFGTIEQADLDVLVTHEPPKGILDTGLSPEQAGVDCEKKTSGPSVKHKGRAEFRTYVQVHEPAVHFFGHVHGSYGETTHEGTRFVNCALTDEDYKLTNEPIEFEL